jgi:hypothetical protein
MFCVWFSTSDEETGLNLAQPWWLLASVSAFPDLVFGHSHQSPRCNTRVEHPAIQCKPVEKMVTCSDQNKQHNENQSKEMWDIYHNRRRAGSQRVVFQATFESDIIYIIRPSNSLNTLQITVTLQSPTDDPLHQSRSCHFDCSPS